MSWKRLFQSLRRKPARRVARRVQLRVEALECRDVPSGGAGDPIQQIDHFIVIYQENWSFDGLYGKFPGANGLANATNSTGALLSQYQQLDKNGNPITTLPNPSTDPHVPGGLPAQPYNLSQYVQPDQKTNDIVHRFYTEQLQIGNGVLQPGTGGNNKFVTWSDNKNLVLSYFDASNLPEGLLAQQYTMDDNFFHAAYGGSFLNHQFLVAAAAPQWNQSIPANFVSSWNPVTQSLGDRNLTIDGKYAVNTTFSANLVPSFVTPGAATLMNSINDSNPNDPNRPFEANIGDRFTDAGVSWKWYSGGWDAAVNLQAAYQSGDPSQIAAAKAPFNDPTNPLNLFQWHHQPFAYFDNYSPLSAGGQAHLQDENNFFSDLSSGNLPAVSFIKPLGPDNEHPGYASLLQGQQHVADIVQAVQNSSAWAHTAIIITYDENGGRWDHVAPPNANGGWGDGTRVPAIVISPYAKRHYVDHTRHDTLSILKTIEYRFGVQPLNQFDAGATSLSSSFGPYLAVGAGDASSTDAILWTRIQNPTGTAGVGLIAQVSTDPTFATGLAGFAGVTDPAQDYTVHIDATGLQPGTRYYYRFVADDGTMSPVGTFVTAPSATANAPISLGFTGDADGLMRPYDATNSANFAPPTSSGVDPQNFDYFVWLGDTIYETASGQGTPNFSPAVNNAPNITEYWRKYREQFLPVSTGTYDGLTNFFDSTGHYTLLDNHELGNRQFISGGAPASAPFNTTDPQFDVNTTGTYMHNTAGFLTTEQAYTDYQPIRVQTVSAPTDPRSDGTQKLYFAQQWGANSIFFNVDDRTYRDIRLRKVSGSGTADDTGVRADNPNRTMLGATELAWLEQSLLSAQQQQVTWKIVAISSPIDQIGAIGSGDDGGKSWMGGYRPERNTLLKFIADNHIDHVVFLSTDDHQLRVNELGYFTQFDANNTPIQSSYVRLPGAFSIIAGPIGATGPDTITDHSFANIMALANVLVAKEMAAGVDPIGLDAAFPGLKNVIREGDANADANRTGFDFYSPDTFNYATLNISADGSTLSVGVKGINSYAVNTFPQPGVANPVRDILSFQIGLEHVNVAASPATAIAGGTTTLTATLTDAATSAPLANRTLVFSLNGNVVGTAITDSSGVATLPNVSVAGLLPGHFAGAITVHFAGDAGDLPGDGSASLDVLPANDVTDKVHIRKNGPVMGPKDGTFTADLTITNRLQSGGAHSATSPTLTGLFAIQLNGLPPGVTLDSATMIVNGVTYNLTITYNAAGAPIINVPASVATSLSAGESLPTINLLFSNPGNNHFDFDTEVFTDPLT